MNIAITGANSGVGTILLGHLASRADVQVVACVRSARAAAALPASPRMSARTIDYDNLDALASVLTGTSCVVHLAGILFESPTTTYQTANVDATQGVVNACKQAGVPRIVLVSVIGADPLSANRYLNSKGRKEQVVAQSGLSGAIIRTPILLGPGMAGAAALVQAASQQKVTLLGGGRHVLRPLDVDDLSVAILHCCEATSAGVALYELVGPEPIAYRDVIARAAGLMGHAISIRSMPVWVAKAGATVAGWTGKRGMTADIIDVVTSSEQVAENADVALGVSLTPLNTTLEKILVSEKKVRHP